MLTASDALDLGFALFGFALMCWWAPGFYQKVQAMRTVLTDFPKKKEEIVVPPFISQASRFARYLLALGLLVGGIAAYFLFRENA